MTSACGEVFSLSSFEYTTIIQIYTDIVGTDTQGYEKQLDRWNCIV